MPDSVHWSIPPALDRAAIRRELDAVLDPELDESILGLGMVQSVTAEGGTVSVELRLPTYWCAANFSYLMAADTRRNLLRVPGVEEVTVRLSGHFAGQAIEDGVNSGVSFTQAFPGEAWGDLEQLRELFLRKGYVARQERLIRELRDAGLSFPEMSSLAMADLTWDGDTCRVSPSGRPQGRPVAGPVARRYLERRADLSLDCSPEGPLLTDLGDSPIAAGELEAYFVRARTARVSAEATGSLCSALLQARNSASTESGSARTAAIPK
jgi:metal-sulfur cluster biosynthetic enzyme